MKKTFILTIFSLLTYTVYGQDFSASTSEARSAYRAGNLDGTRFALEQALQTLDQEIGKEILKILPTNMLGATYNLDDDNVVGTNFGFAGLFVDRKYYAEDKNASIQIIGDSPLLAGINAILAMPGIVTSGDPNQKRIRVDGYRALMQKNSRGDGKESYSIQIPANATLITLECEGYNETEVTSIANQIPVSQIVKLAQ